MTTCNNNGVSSHKKDQRLLAIIYPELVGKLFVCPRGKIVQFVAYRNGVRQFPIVYREVETGIHRITSNRLLKNFQSV